MSNAIKNIVETLKNTDNEGTESPWWMIIDPDQLHGMFVYGDREVPSAERVANVIACSVEGPFFSREDAENYLKARSYDYSENTIVWCGSGHRSQKYKALCREVVKANQSEDKKT